MKFTNIHNLPEPLFNALIRDDYKHEGDISVSQLILPPRIRQLQLRHDQEIIEDAATRIWSVLGKVGHKIIEREDVPNGFKEERLYLNIKGWKVAAKPDLWQEPGKLQDYKYTTVWSYIFGLKIEWEQQLNMYAPFYKDAGFKVDALEDIAIFRDWQMNKAKQDKKYPQVPVAVMNVPLWSYAKQIAFLEERVKWHQKGEILSDEHLPICTPEERWEKPIKYAVMKPKRKRALRVFETQKEAYDYQGLQPKKDKTYIEKRHYCNVQQFCNQWKELKGEN